MTDTSSETPHLIITVTEDADGWTVEAELGGEDHLAAVCAMTSLAADEARRLHNQAHALYRMRN